MSSNAERSRAYRDRKRGGQPRQLAPCGTVPAARRHQRSREPLCAFCAPVWAEHQAKMYRQRKGAQDDT